MYRIHVIGTGPRTGTTLMAEALGACCNIDCATEHEDNLFQRPGKKCNIYLTKFPSDLFVITPSLLVDPSLYVICLVRDPRDMVVSKHGKEQSKYYATLRYWTYLYPRMKALRWHKRFIIVKYEDFVNSPNSVQEMLVKLIPFLKNEHSFSDYHKVAQPSADSQKALLKVRPISPEGIGKWKLHLPRIKQQLAIHGDISKDLIEMGYENDTNWLDILTDIVSYEGDSHWPEHFETSDIKNRTRSRYIEAVRRIIIRLGLRSPYFR